jgi:transposase
VVERQVNKVDHSKLHALYRGRGDQPFDPVPMLKMVLYQYLIGCQSPAQWAKKARDHDEMKWLGRGYVPSRSAWYNFRDRTGNVIEEIHNQIVRRAVDEELIDPTIGVLDGTSMAACASRHRMQNRPRLDKRIEILNAIIADTTMEDLPKWIPPTESGRLELAHRMEVASDVLDQRIEANGAKPKDRRKDPNKIVVSISDPDAPLGRDKMKVYRPMYTTQFMVVPFSYFILSYCCEASSTDAGTLAPMIDKTNALVDDRLETVAADCGYCSILDLKACHERNIELLAPVDSGVSKLSKQKSDSGKITREDFIWDAENNFYRCPNGNVLDYLDRGRKWRLGGQFLWESRYRSNPADCQSCPLLAKCLKSGATSKTLKRLEGQELFDQQRQKMAEPSVQERFKLRGQTVELAFADAKGNRQMTRFHGRGLARARAETGLLVVALNLLRLDKIERKAIRPSEITT